MSDSNKPYITVPTPPPPSAHSAAPVASHHAKLPEMTVPTMPPAPPGSTVEQKTDNLVKWSQNQLIGAGLDFNGDHKVALAEFKTALTKHGRTEHDALAADGNANNQLDAKEVQALFAKKPGRER